MISGRVGQPNHLVIYLTLEYVQQHLFINPEEKKQTGNNRGTPTPDQESDAQPWRF